MVTRDLALILAYPLDKISHWYHAWKINENEKMPRRITANRILHISLNVKPHTHFLNAFHSSAKKKYVTRPRDK